MPFMEIGKQIKTHRAKFGLSQEEFADKIFVTRQTVSNWENDKSYPDIKQPCFDGGSFRRFSRFFGKRRY